MRNVKDVISRALRGVLVWVAKAGLGLAVLAFVVLVLFEWTAGCGETYIDAKGKRHPHECLFIGKYVSVTTRR